MEKTILEGIIGRQIRSLISSNGQDFNFQSANNQLSVTEVEILNITVQSTERTIIGSCHFIGTVRLTTPDGDNFQSIIHRIEGCAFINDNDAVEVNENIGISD